MRLQDAIRSRALPLLLAGALAFAPLPLAAAQEQAPSDEPTGRPGAAWPSVETPAFDAAVQEEQVFPDAAADADVDAIVGTDGALQPDGPFPEPGDSGQDQAASNPAEGGMPEADEGGRVANVPGEEAAAAAVDAGDGEVAGDAPAALDEVAPNASGACEDVSAEDLNGDDATLPKPDGEGLPPYAVNASAQEEAPVLATQALPGYAPALQPAVGVLPLVVIVAGFLGEDGGDAVPYDAGYDWGNTIFTSPEGVSAFYRDMSGGAFTFTPAHESSAYGVDGNGNLADAANDGIVHVTLPQGHGHWGDAYYRDVNVASSLLAAFTRIVQAADAYVNFAQYDANGDGRIDEGELAVAFIIAGYEAATDDGSIPASVPLLWSHAWSYSDAGLAPPVADGVTLDRYIAIAEKLYGEDGAGEEGERQEPLSVLVHELAHNLGLPDLYDTTGDAAGPWSEYQVGSSSLMDTGTWAGVVSDSGAVDYVPSGLDAWSRYQLGWTAPTVVKSSGTYTVSAQGSENGYATLLIPTGRAGEYYLLENRLFSGHDAGLAYDYPDFTEGGIVIWHIDNGVVTRYLADNQVNASSHRPGVMPLFWEEDEDWNYTLSFGDSTPSSSLVFWSLRLWNDYFARYATALDLPLYGVGAAADDPAARYLSGIKVEFLTNAGPNMQVRITFPVPEQEQPLENELAVTTAKDKAATLAASAAAESSPLSQEQVQEQARPIPATGDAVPRTCLLLMLLSGLACLPLTLCSLRHGFAGVVSLRVAHDVKGLKWHW